MARTLGVDVGTVRIGLALSDPSGRVATPLETLRVDDPAPAVIAERLLRVAGEHDCKVVVIGLPRGMSGRDTAATGYARQVAEQLRGRGPAVELQDERLTSVQAERVLVGAGRRRNKRRQVRDQVAAAIILQAWLDARAG